MEILPPHSNRCRVYVGILLTLSLLFLVSVSRTYLFFGFSVASPKAGLLVFSRILHWLCLGLILLYSFKIEKQKFLLWEENKYPFFMYLLSIAALVGILFACSVVTGVIIKLAGLYTVSKRLLQMVVIFREHKILVVFTALTAGVVEELIMRGYLQPRLEIIFKNPALAIIISAVIFGGLHFGYGTVGNVVGPFLFGLVFGFYYWRYRNIKVLIICHFLWDIVSIMLLLKTYH